MVKITSFACTPMRVGKASGFLVVVTATDTAGGVGHLQVTVQIQDQNEFAPTFNISEFEDIIDEDQPIGTTLFTFFASDQDGTDDRSEVKQ